MYLHEWCVNCKEVIIWKENSIGDLYCIGCGSTDCDE